MIKIWADCLIAGTKRWAEVKEARREAVKAELLRRVEAGELSQDDYLKIVGLEEQQED